jgi:xylose isomerase
VDVSPEGDSLRSYQDNFAIMTDKLLEKQQETGVVKQFAVPHSSFTPVSCCFSSSLSVMMAKLS